MSASKEGISLPGEAADKCCFCIPIKPGVVIIGLIMVIDAVWGVLGVLNLLKHANLLIYAIISGVAIAPLVLGAYFYVRFFMEDNATTRGGLSKACMLVILSALILCGVSVFQLILGDNTFGGVLD